MGQTRRVTTLEHAGLRFDVYDEGPLEGEVIVLLHGFPERSTCWAKVTPLLNQAGYRTLAMDQRGYSPGARPRRRRDYAIDLLVSDVVALIRRAGAPVHLVGHDWGGFVAWTLAGSRPDLLRTLTVVSVPHPAAFRQAVLRSRQVRKSWYMLAFQLPRLPERLLADPSGSPREGMSRSGMSQDDVERFRREIVDDGALTYALNSYRGLPFSDRRMLARPVTVPTTLVWSDADTAVGREGVDRTPPFVHAPYELVVLEGVSHWIPTHAPTDLADAVLRRVGAH